MTQAGLPTLDQLSTFVAVVEEGSFAAAARRRNRAVSVVSYTVANLEAQLGVALFEREGTKRPRLTEAGHAVLAEARAIAQGVGSLRSKVNGMLQGLEAEVSLAVDVMLPQGALSGVLRRFATEFPTVALRLHVEALGAVTALVLDGRAVVGISGPLSAVIDDLDSMAVGMVPLVPVAAPAHPLARFHPVPPGEIRKHVQLVLTDRSPLTEGRDFSVSSPRTWRLADLGAKHALLREGIGWGNMPLPLVEDDLASGALVRIDASDHQGGNYRFSGVWRRISPPGPAAAWLLARFREILSKGGDAEMSDV